MDVKNLLKQSNWRKIGAGTILLAALMALYSVPGGVLHDSVIHLTGLFSEQVADRSEANRSIQFCFLYWAVFALLIFASLYMAMLDLRFIRLQYDLEKQKLFHQTMGEDGLDPTPREEDASKPENPEAHKEEDR